MNRSNIDKNRKRLINGKMQEKIEKAIFLDGSQESSVFHKKENQ